MFLVLLYRLKAEMGEPALLAVEKKFGILNMC